MADTKIEWATKVWNPVTGCTPVHAGCDNCYAKRIAGRHLPGHGFDDRDFSVVRCHPERLMEPLHWRKPARIFVDSMGDLFHKDVPFEFVDRVFAVMALCPQHTFIVLTKRPERMLEYFAAGRYELTERWSSVDDISEDSQCFIANWINGWSTQIGLKDNNPLNGTVPRWPLPQVILGASVCDQPSADRMLPEVLQTPAARRVVSIEPMLGPVDLRLIQWPNRHRVDVLRFGYWSIPGKVGEDGFVNHSDMHDMFGRPIDWVICGGETGPDARPMHPDWVRSLRDQCQSAVVPFFFKQWGEYSSHAVDPEKEFCHLCCIDSLGRHCALSHRTGEPWWFLPPYPGGRGTWGPDGIPPGVVEIRHVGKKTAGCLLDGREWKQFPEAHA